MVNDQASALLRLATLLLALTGLDAGEILIGHGDRPRPASVHLTLIPLADLGKGLPARNDDGNVAHARELQVLLTAYGKDAIVGLRAASVLLWSDASEMFEFVADGMSVVAVGGVSDQTAVLHTSYEPRAAMNVTVGYVVVVEAANPPEADQIRVAVNGTPDVIVLPPDEEPVP